MAPQAPRAAGVFFPYWARLNARRQLLLSLILSGLVFLHPLLVTAMTSNLLRLYILFIVLNVLVVWSTSGLAAEVKLEFPDENATPLVCEINGGQLTLSASATDVANIAATCSNSGQAAVIAAGFATTVEISNDGLFDADDQPTKELLQRLLGKSSVGDVTDQEFERFLTSVENIENSPPTAEINAKPACSGLTCTFDASASRDAQDTIDQLSFAWTDASNGASVPIGTGKI